MGRPLDRLTAEDAAILALERGVVAGHTLKVAILDPPAGGALPSVDALREHVGARLDRAPRLRERLAFTPLRLAPPAWVDDVDFDISRHVRPAAAAEVDERGLAMLAAEGIRRRLDRAHPLWLLEAARMTGGRMALVWTLHHCMADGEASMRLGDEVLWDPAPDTPQPPPSTWRPAPEPTALALAVAGAGERVRLGLARTKRLGPPAAGGLPGRLRGLLRRELRAPAERSPLDRPLSSQRAAAFASTTVTQVKAIAGAAPVKATVNDVVLAAVAGALRRWLVRHHGEVHDLRVKVPVSLHHPGREADTAANRDSFLYATLPLGEPDPRERLARIAAETAERKREHDAEALDRLLAELHRASPTLEHLAKRLAGRARMFALNVSNVRGPAEPRYVLGARLRELRSLAEISPGHPLRVAATSLGDLLAFGLCADSTVIEDVERLAADLSAELSEMAGRATSS